MRVGAEVSSSTVVTVMLRVATREMVMGSSIVVFSSLITLVYFCDEMFQLWFPGRFGRY